MDVSPARVTTVRVAVHSSHRLLRDTLAAFLAGHPDITVVGKVAEAAGVLTLCELRQPDAVVLNAGCCLHEIAAPAGGLTQRYPELNVIVTYRDASKQELAAACSAGVTSLVPESHGPGAVLAMLRRRRRSVRASRAGLTDREVELVVLLGSGHSVAEIAELLGISPFTVQNLKRRAYDKLEVSSSAHAVARAASFGMLGFRPPPRQHAPSAANGSRTTLTLVSASSSPALGEVVSAVVAAEMPFVLERTIPSAAGTDWEPWSPGPAALALVDPGPAELDAAAAHGVPVVLVHSQPLATSDVAEALACGVDAFVAADQARGQFMTVLRTATQGYLVIDSARMRAIIQAMHARDSSWQELPELTARERDILRCSASGKSIRQTARVLGIAPKTVENVQTGLFRKLGVRNRPEALAIAEGLGLLPAAVRTPHPDGRALP